jgi:hypothetical protein
MNNLSGFNTQEMRRLHPYLTTLFRQLKSLEARVDAGTKIIWGKDQAYRYRRPRGGARYQLLFPLVRVNFELGVIMVIAVSCVKLLSAHNSTQHTSRKHKV